jgi:isoleucyl-tRNA synthetase
VGQLIEFNEAAEKMGADTMRWLYASCKPEQNLLRLPPGDETRRRFLIPLWNVYSFLTYANAAAGKQGPGARGQGPGKRVLALEPGTWNLERSQLDRWIVARLDETTLDVRAALDAWDAERAAAALEAAAR